MSRYAAAHANPQGQGDARPTALDIVRDENMEGKLDGKMIVITGTSSGIGIETARALATTGASLILTARDLPKARKALGSILDSEKVQLVELELDSFESVRAAASTILSKTDKINILVNNAGVMATPDVRLTRDGHEMQFGTNHLGHFLLFELLKPAILAASTPEFQSRVVNLSSVAHVYSGINASDNYNYQKGGYAPWAAYGQSKTANIYMANEIERRYGCQGIHATSLHPGGIGTELGRHLDPAVMAEMMKDTNLMKYIKSVEQGAATTVWAAIGKEWEGKGGKYLTNCRVAEGIFQEGGDIHGSNAHAAHAYKPEDEARLWEDSLKIVGLA